MRAVAFDAAQIGQVVEKAVDVEPVATSRTGSLRCGGYATDDVEHLQCNASILPAGAPRLADIAGRNRSCDPPSSGAQPDHHGRVCPAGLRIRVSQRTANRDRCQASVGMRLAASQIPRTTARHDGRTYQTISINLTDPSTTLRHVPRWGQAPARRFDRPAGR